MLLILIVLLLLLGGGGFYGYRGGYYGGGGFGGIVGHHRHPASGQSVRRPRWCILPGAALVTDLLWDVGLYGAFWLGSGIGFLLGAIIGYLVARKHVKA